MTPEERARSYKTSVGIDLADEFRTVYAEGRAAALGEAAGALDPGCSWCASRIRALINQGRDEVAPSLAEKK